MHRLLLFFPLLGPAAAFMPTKFFAAQGWLGYSHEEMCHDSMKEIVKDLYLQYKPTKTMDQARIEVARGNSDTDHDFHSSEKHFDGESIPEAQKRLQRLRRHVVALLREQQDASGAREALGNALHTVQDFYSHSNWIELGNTEPHPALGRPVEMNRLPAEVATCQPCIKEKSWWPKCANCQNNLLFTAQSSLKWEEQGLTTGYYSDESRIKPNDKKCSHGGLFDQSTSSVGGGLNKDTISCHMSPHSHMHWAAIHMATRATTQYIMDIIEELTAAETAALLGVGPQSAIAFEKHRRAGEAVRLAKDRLKGVIRHGGRGVTKRDNSSSTYQAGEVLFLNTPLNGVGHPSEITTGTASQGNQGNSSCEGSGLLHSLSKIPSGANFFVFLDGEKQEEISHYHVVAHAASSRGIRIFPVNEDDNISEAERLVSQLTGGEVVPADHASKLLDMPEDAEIHTILRTSAHGTHQVPVDSSITTLIINGASEVKDPSGKVVSSCTKIIKNPTPGTWSVCAKNAGLKEISVTAVSNLNLGGLHMTQVQGRPGHTGFFPVQNVMAGSSYTAVTNAACGITKQNFQLHQHAPSHSTVKRSAQSGCIPTRKNIEVPMVRADNLTDLHANVTVPSGAYSFVLTGVDDKGHEVRRQLPVPVRAAEYGLNIHGMILVDNAGVATANVHVSRGRTGGSAEKISLTTSITNRHYDVTQGGGVSELSLQPGESREVTVKVKLGSVKTGSATLLAVLKTNNGEHIVASRILPLEEDDAPTEKKCEQKQKV